MKHQQPSVRSQKRQHSTQVLHHHYHGTFKYQKGQRPAALLLTRLHRLLCLPFVVLSLLRAFPCSAIKKKTSVEDITTSLLQTSKIQARQKHLWPLHSVFTKSVHHLGRVDGGLSCFTSLWLIKARHIPAPSFVLSTRQVQELSICTPLEYDDISSFGSASALG